MALSSLLASPELYCLFQAPFVQDKLRPVLEHCELRPERSLIDIGCGPGINCGVLGKCRYLGVDLSKEYIEFAKRKFPAAEFIAGDACKDLPSDRKFDIVILNSLMHHLSDEQTQTLLTGVTRLLAPGGEVHIVDLILPERAGIPRKLALSDRGQYPRSHEAWLKHFQIFRCVEQRSFFVKKLGIALWELIYFKGTL